MPVVPKTPYVSEEEMAVEIAKAMVYDLKYNTNLMDALNEIIRKHGAAGEKIWHDLWTDDIKREFDGKKGPVLFPWLRSAFRTYSSGIALHEQLGQVWGFIGGLLSAGIQAGTAIYTTRLQINGQEDIAKLKLQQDQANADRALAAANAQQAQAVAAMQGNVSGSPFAAAGMMGGMGEILPYVLIAGAAIFILPKILKG